MTPEYLCGCCYLRGDNLLVTVRQTWKNSHALAVLVMAADAGYYLLRIDKTESTAGGSDKSCYSPECSYPYTTSVGYIAPTLLNLKTKATDIILKTKGKPDDGSEIVLEIFAHDSTQLYESIAAVINRTPHMKSETKDAKELELVASVISSMSRAKFHAAHIQTPSLTIPGYGTYALLGYKLIPEELYTQINAHRKMLLMKHGVNISDSNANDVADYIGASIVLEQAKRATSIPRTKRAMKTLEDAMLSAWIRIHSR